MFAREGYAYILGAAAIAVITFAMALRLRSWPLWIAALVLTILALSVAWVFRNPERIGEREPNAGMTPAKGMDVLGTVISWPTRMLNATLPVSRFGTLTAESMRANRLKT